MLKELRIRFIDRCSQSAIETKRKSSSTLPDETGKATCCWADDVNDANDDDDDYHDDDDDYHDDDDDYDEVVGYGCVWDFEAVCDIAIWKLGCVPFDVLKCRFLRFRLIEGITDSS